MTTPINDVCDGCWKRGVCERKSCTCPCSGGTVWRHADDKRQTHPGYTAAARRA